jgi:hypothetical protein
MLLEGGVPGGIEGAEIVEELADGHPLGQLLVFGDVADVSEDFAGNIGYGVAEHLCAARGGAEDVHTLREFSVWRHCLPRSTRLSSLETIHPCSQCPLLRKVFHWIGTSSFSGPIAGMPESTAPKLGKYDNDVSRRLENDGGRWILEALTSSQN